ncbi:probable ATP-dependent RNA helicase DDX20 isoform X2 [Cylas formicarius]|uniref:probable ATP-dependent RNA helicase DDX20 isoform X2 n=1 Tax=Cylas formicarius TaxID=197179 RepID=UPI002958AEFE|nr:probable ATP-dependent RNA helicase DDX20 isoform X2 [Cylas formicarius]
MSETKKLAHSLEDKTRTRDVIAEGNVSFESLVLPGNVLKGLIDNGFHKASPIQIKAIPLGKCGFDLLVKSKSGTGKTLVFTIVALDTIDFAKIGPQILVVTPTREIAVQIRDVFKAVGCYFDGLNVEYFIGGFPIEQDKLKCRSCHVAIGTPGRLKQLIQTGILNAL